MRTLQKIHLPSQFLYFRLDYPTYPFKYFGNIDLSTCRLVDLSTCRPVDLVLLSTTNIYICHLYVLPKLNCRLVDLSTCRLVDLSTCRPSAIVNNKDPVRVRVRVSVLLGFLGWARVRVRV